MTRFFKTVAFGQWPINRINQQPANNATGQKDSLNDDKWTRQVEPVERSIT